MRFISIAISIFAAVFFITGCADMVPNDHELHRWKGFIDGTKIPKTARDIEEDSNSCKQAVAVNKPGEVSYAGCMFSQGYRWE